MASALTITRCKGDGDPGDLVGLRESAELLGVDPPGVSRWRKAGQMPTLVADLRSGPVWLRADVVAMAAAREEAAAARQATASASAA